MPSSSSMTMYCAITAENGKRVPVTIDSVDGVDGVTTMTATKLRFIVSRETKIPLEQLRLIFRGRMIKDDDTNDVVMEYKLEGDCVLHCMGKPSATATAPAPVAVAATSSAPMISAVSTTTTAAAQQQQQQQQQKEEEDPIRAGLEILRLQNSSDKYLTAVTTLDKILTNIIQNPMEEKYRKVKVHNAAFQKRLGGLPGGKECILGSGFNEITDITDNGDENGGGTSTTTQVYKLEASADAWPKLQSAKVLVEQAAQQAKRQQQQQQQQTTMPNNTSSSSSAAVPPSMGGSNFNPFLGGMMAPPPGSANANAANAAAANLLSNPQALQSMMSNPMVQQMIQNDPSIPPHMRQMMEQLVSNPGMMNQVTQMMADPTVRQRMETMMSSSSSSSSSGFGGGLPNNNNFMPGMFGGGGSGLGGGMPPVPNNNNNNGSNTNNNPGGPSSSSSSSNDQGQTEEDMIAEAIRRSLEDN